MWPFRTVVVHRIEGLELLAAAIVNGHRARAEAEIEAAHVVRGHREPEPPPPPPKAPPDPYEERLKAFAALKGWGELQTEHAVALSRIVLCKQPETPDWPRGKALAFLHSAGAPIPGSV